MACIVDRKQQLLKETITPITSHHHLVRYLIMAVCIPDLFLKHKSDILSSRQLCFLLPIARLNSKLGEEISNYQPFLAASR